MIEHLFRIPQLCLNDPAHDYTSSVYVEHPTRSTSSSCIDYEVDRFIVRDEKPPKPSWENKEENLIIIKNKEKISDNLLIRSLSIISKSGVTKSIAIIYQRFEHDIQLWGYKRLAFLFFIGFITKAIMLLS